MEKIAVKCTVNHTVSVNVRSIPFVREWLGKNAVQKIDKEILSLEDYPCRCPLVQDEIMREIEIRKLIVNGYIIFFKINEEKKRVGILRIIKGNRNWQKMI